MGTAIPSKGTFYHPQIAEEAVEQRQNHSIGQPSTVGSYFS
jgi:hypothetical protein